MKYAIVQSGGKQYKAVPGEILQVDKLPLEEGKKYVLGDVLFIADGVKKVTIGTPLIKGAKVETTVTGQIKGPKIRVFKYKPKVRYRRRQGHRQQYTLLQVEKIVAASSTTKTKTTSSKSAPKASSKTKTKAASSKAGTKTGSKSTKKSTSTKTTAKSASKSTKKTTSSSENSTTSSKTKKSK
jgi:large subunit ribosomal protein L21